MKDEEHDKVNCLTKLGCRKSIWLEVSATTELGAVWKSLKKQTAWKNEKSNSFPLRSCLWLKRTICSHFPGTPQNSTVSTCQLWNIFCTSYHPSVLNSVVILQVNSSPTLLIAGKRDHSILLYNCLSGERSLSNISGPSSNKNN